MKLSLRNASSIAALMLVGVLPPAFAQTAKNVRFLVGSPAGGSITDSTPSRETCAWGSNSRNDSTSSPKNSTPRGPASPPLSKPCPANLAALN